MAKSIISFKSQPIHKRYGNPIFDVYYVIENGRSRVMESFQALNRNDQDQIVDLISKMATVEDFQSNNIQKNLKGYNYGELTPHPHRFFFFQKCGNNYIFFHYIKKRVRSLRDRVYRDLERKKDVYEKEFKKFIQRN